MQAPHKLFHRRSLWLGGFRVGALANHKLPNQARADRHPLFYISRLGRVIIFEGGFFFKELFFGWGGLGKRRGGERQLLIERR